MGETLSCFVNVIFQSHQHQERGLFYWHIAVSIWGQGSGPGPFYWAWYCHFVSSFAFPQCHRIRASFPYSYLTFLDEVSVQICWLILCTRFLLSFKNALCSWITVLNLRWLLQISFPSLMFSAWCYVSRLGSLFWSAPFFHLFFCNSTKF